MSKLEAFLWGQPKKNFKACFFKKLGEGLFASLKQHWDFIPIKMGEQENYSWHFRAREREVKDVT